MVDGAVRRSTRRAPRASAASLAMMVGIDAEAGEGESTDGTARGPRARMIDSAVPLCSPSEGSKARRSPRSSSGPGRPVDRSITTFPRARTSSSGRPSTPRAPSRSISSIGSAGAPADEVAAWSPAHLARGPGPLRPRCRLRGAGRDRRHRVARAARACRPDLPAWRSTARGRLLEQGGLTTPDARDRSRRRSIASCEGAVALSRAEQSLEPFDLVADQLMRQVRVLARSGRARPARTFQRRRRRRRREVMPCPRAFRAASAISGWV